MREMFYHGSMDYLPVGTILTPRSEEYEKDWGHTDFYQALEYYRPSDLLAHKQAVFMVGTEDDADLAGGGTNWLFAVKPLGPVQRHDMNWSSEISTLIDQGYQIDDDEIKRAALNYWNGIPHHDENVWEYLAPKAQILAVEEY